MKTSSNRSKQARSKPEKTRAQKDAHNASCRKSRQKNKRMREELEKKYSEMELNLKRMREELEKKTTEMTEMELNFQRIQHENKRMKLELNEKNSRNRSMEETLQKQKEEKARLDQWKLKQGCSSSVEECQDWILRQRYDQVGQGYYTSLLTGPAAQPSLLSNQNLFSASDVQITDNDLLLPQYQSGVLTDSPTRNSFLANQNLSNQDVLSMINELLYTDNNDYATGCPTASAAGLPDFTHHEPAVKHDEDFCSEKNPPSKRN